MDISHRIKVLRERSGKSQEEIAAELGISRSTLAGIEQGKRDNPRLKTMREIVKACGATMSDLFPGKSSIRYDDSEVGDEEHAEIYRKLRSVLKRSKRSEYVLRGAIDAAYKELNSKRPK